MPVLSPPNPNAILPGPLYSSHFHLTSPLTQISQEKSVSAGPTASSPNLTLSPLPSSFSGPLDRDRSCKAPSPTAPHGHSQGTHLAYFLGPWSFPLPWNPSP